jgi:hypothetical protein
MSIEKRARIEYEILAETGELLEMFPNLTGSWKSDREEFLKFHEMNEEILKIESNLELDDLLDDVY